MKTSHLLLLIVVFAALLWAVLYRKQTATAPRPDDAAAVEAVLKPKDFDRQRVAAITLGRQGDARPLRLEKRDSGWVVASAWNAPADADKVAGLFDAVERLRGALRSEVAAAHGKYDVDAEKGLRLTLNAAPGPDGQAGANLFDLYVGKAPTDLYAGNYVRLAGDERSYVTTAVREALGLSAGDQGRLMPGDRRFWLDTRVAKFPPERLLDLEIQTPDHVMVLARREPAPPADKAEAAKPEPAGEKTDAAKTDGDKAGEAVAKAPAVPAEAAAAAGAGYDPAGASAWRLVRGGWGAAASPRAEAVEGLLRTVGALEAEDVDDPSSPAAKALEHPTRSLRATLTGGGKVTLDAVHDPNDGKFRLRLSTRPEMVYVISEAVAKRLFPSGGQFFALTPPRPDAKAVTHIEYHRGRHAFSFERHGEEWKPLASPGFPLRPEAVAGMLAAAGDWQPVDYADPAGRERFGLVEPSARTTFVTPAGATVLALGRRNDEGNGYVNTGDGQPLVADAAASGRLFPPFSALFNLKLFDADAAEVESLTVSRPDQPSFTVRFAPAAKAAAEPAPENAEGKDAAKPAAAEPSAWWSSAGGAETPVKDGARAATLREKALALSGGDLRWGPADKDKDAEWRDVKLSLRSARGSVEVSFGPVEGEYRPAKRSERAAVMVPAKEVAALLEAFLSLKEPEAVPAPTATSPIKAAADQDKTKVVAEPKDAPAGIVPAAAPAPKEAAEKGQEKTVAEPKDHPAPSVEGAVAPAVTPPAKETTDQDKEKVVAEPKGAPAGSVPAAASAAKEAADKGKEKPVGEIKGTPAPSGDDAGAPAAAPAIKGAADDDKGKSAAEPQNPSVAETAAPTTGKVEGKKP